MVLNPEDIGLSKQDLFGEIKGDKFVVHKLPMHVMRIYQSFGVGEKRLTGMHYQGVSECIVLFHPNREETECYTVKLSEWIEKGIRWENKLDNGRTEWQKHLPIDQFEKS